MTNHDIVARLRSLAAEFPTLDDIMDSEWTNAADEIERLREELMASHESHGNEVGALTERLSLAIHERDEARREVCEWVSLQTKRQPCAIATERGWNCFEKEDE